MKKENICHDCGKKIEIENQEIKNGVYLTYQGVNGPISVFKCQQCFARSQELKNYQPCEVYSRIVGYLRPVSQWNEGKQKEFKQRKEYNLTN